MFKHVLWYARQSGWWERLVTTKSIIIKVGHQYCYVAASLALSYVCQKQKSVYIQCTCTTFLVILLLARYCYVVIVVAGHLRPFLPLTKGMQSNYEIHARLLCYCYLLAR